MTGSAQPALSDRIRSLSREGVKGVEIALRLGCTRSYVSQVLCRPEIERKPLTAVQVSRPAERPRQVTPDTCQRPDARKGFATCGEPKMRTGCGEKLGVCAYHFETTKPLGGTKL